MTQEISSFFQPGKERLFIRGSIILFCCVSLQSLSHSQDKVKTKVVEWRVVFQGGHSVCLVVSEKSGETVSGSCCSIREKSERDHWSFSHTLLPGFCRSWNKHSPLQKWLTLLPPVKVGFNLMTLFVKIWMDWTTRKNLWNQTWNSCFVWSISWSLSK